MTLFYLAFIPVVFVAALVGFVRLERAGRVVVVVVVLLVVELVGGLLYTDTATTTPPAATATGGPNLFHPAVGGQNLRTLDLCVLAALVAHVVVRGLPRRVSLFGLAWSAWLVWFGASAVLGVLNHNPFPQNAFETKAGLYVALLAVAGAVPAHAWVDDVVARRFLVASAVAAGAMTVAQLAGAHGTFALPLLPGAVLPAIGADTASVFVSLGVLALALAVTADRYRLGLLLVATLDLAAPFAITQRAALLGMAAALLVLAGCLVSGRLKLRLAGGEAAVVLATVCVAVVGVFFVRVVTHQPGIPLQQHFQSTFLTMNKQQSAADRLNQLHQSSQLIRSSPVFGHGQGTFLSYYEVGTRKVANIDITHNILTDLLVREGAVGLAFFLMAIGVTLAEGLRVAARARDPLVGAFAAAGTAIVAGWLAKGLVESIFEKYQLVLVLGIAVGLVHSMARAEQTARDPVNEPRVTAPAVRS